MSRVNVTIADFLTRVRKTEACWVWARCTQFGYGVTRYKGITRKAHCVSWLLHFGEIPLGLLVLHRCDNRSCVNPGHLFLGTHADNTRDMLQKGRQIFQYAPSRHVRGERCPSAKLNEVQVVEIKQALLQGARQVDLALKYSVSDATINAIAHSRWWVHVKVG